MESVFITALKAVGMSPACIIAIICIAVLCYVIRHLFTIIDAQSKALSNVTVAVAEIKTLIGTVLSMGGAR